MRKHNIGRISIIVIALNIIFALIYLADKNDVSFTKTQVETETEEISQTNMLIHMDETVDGEYVTILENIISDKKYSKQELAIVNSYDWYLTDIITNTESYCINNDEITIFAADDKFVTYVNEVLSEIINQ